MMKNNIYVYELDGNLYINLTNKCSNACEFCVRNGKDSYYGNELWLDKEPSAKDVLEAIDYSKRYNEVVFCGFGEPTYKLDELIEIAGELKEKNYVVRLNTNGQGNLIHGYDITTKLAMCVDKINVSLNASDSEKYQKICHSIYGEDAFFALLSFAKLAEEKSIDVNLSIVDCIGEAEVAKCQALADQNGLKLKVRKMITNS